VTPRTVVHYSDSGTFGGTERAILHLLAGLDPDRWRARLLVHKVNPGGTMLADGARSLGIPVTAVRPPRGAHDLPAIAQLATAMRAAGTVVLHAHLTWPLSCWHGVLAARLARASAVVATAQLFVPLTCVQLALQRVMRLGVDRYIAVSHEVARQLVARLGVPAVMIDVIPNAVSLAEPAPDAEAVAAARRAMDGGSGWPVVLAVSRLDPQQKGLVHLLGAAARVPNAIVAIAGEGPERPALEARALSLGVGDRVRLLGFRRDVPALLAACDVVALPSLFEGLPLALLEGMAAGKPVVATAIGGTDEAVVDGVTGLLVPPRDAEALAAALRRVLGDPPLAQRLGDAGRARAVAEFSIERMIERVMGVYDAVLACDAERGRPHA
jgi:glycosyltransferase involved in cell wall biosynthesis